MNSKKRSSRGTQQDDLAEILNTPLAIPVVCSGVGERVYAIQRRLIGRDSARWRTVTYVAAKHRVASMAPAVKLAKLSLFSMELRIVEECSDGSYQLEHSWNDKDGWH